MKTKDSKAMQLPNKKDRLVLLVGQPAQILTLGTDGKDVQILLDRVGGTPDGVAVDLIGGYIYWTDMGENYGDNDGYIERIRLDGSDREVIVAKGETFTPKQMALDKKNDLMYWCDREGMRIMRARMDGREITVLVQTGFGDEDRKDETRHCVGIDIDSVNGHIYWTQKGPPNGGQGRIFRAGIEIPEGESSAERSDIELLLQGLPEPIDLEIDHHGACLYWTDRGGSPSGNTLNRARMTTTGLTDHQVLSGGLHEGIGLALALKRGYIFTTDLGGFVRRFDGTAFDSSEVIYIAKGQLTGIAYAEAE
jgi:hypothetical protein